MEQDYLKKQQQLHSTAQQILQKLNLVEFLSKFGDVHFVGSFELQLMSWEDIDIVIIQKPKPSYNDYLETVKYLFPLEEIYSLTLQDFRKSIYPDRPQGIYCGIKYLMKPDIFWKIDVWFSSEDNNAVETVENIKSKLTPENRKIILQIKNEMRASFPHGKEISGIDVYNAVLEKNVSTIEEFKNYLLNVNRHI